MEIMVRKVHEVPPLMKDEGKYEESKGAVALPVPRACASRGGEGRGASKKSGKKRVTNVSAGSSP